MTALPGIGLVREVLTEFAIGTTLQFIEFQRLTHALLTSYSYQTIPFHQLHRKFGLPSFFERPPQFLLLVGVGRRPL